MRQIPSEPGNVLGGVAIVREANAYVASYSQDEIGIIQMDDRFEVLYRDPLAEWMNRPTNLALREDAIYVAKLEDWHIGAVNHRLQPALRFLPS